MYNKTKRRDWYYAYCKNFRKQWRVFSYTNSYEVKICACCDGKVLLYGIENTKVY